MAWDIRDSKACFLFLFYIFNTEPNPQRSVKEHKKDNRWPIYCHGVMLLRQIYSILVFLIAQLLARFLYTEHVRQRRKRKRLVTTPEGLLVRPCSWSRCVFLNTPAWDRRCPGTITHAHTRSKTLSHTYTLTYVLHSEEVSFVSAEGELNSSEVVSVSLGHRFFNHF